MSEIMQQEESSEDIYTASQWQLMERKFRKHRLAVWSGMIVIMLYLGALTRRRL